MYGLLLFGTIFEHMDIEFLCALVMAKNPETKWIRVDKIKSFRIFWIQKYYSDENRFYHFPALLINNGEEQLLCEIQAVPEEFTWLIYAE